MVYIFVFLSLPGARGYDGKTAHRGSTENIEAKFLQHYLNKPEHVQAFFIKGHTMIRERLQGLCDECKVELS